MAVNGYIEPKESIEGEVNRIGYNDLEKVVSEATEATQKALNAAESILPDGVIINSSTSGSNKRFKIVVNDDGVISAKLFREPVPELSITIRLTGDSSYTSISLYVDGEKQYTSPVYGGICGIAFAKEYTNVTEAYIVLEENMGGVSRTTVNGELVWGDNQATGSTFDLLALESNTITIVTNFND